MSSALRFVFLLLIILNPFRIHAQLLTWFNFNWHSTNSSSPVIKVTGDNAGNTFYLLQVYGSITVDNTVITASSPMDFLIVKRTSTNALAWYRKITCATAYGCRSITADSAGNVYIIGNYQGFPPVYFDSTISTTASLPLQQEQSAFFAKYDSTGTLQWTKVIQGQYSNTWQVGIDIDLVLMNGESIVISGIMDGNCDFDPDTGTCIVGNNGGMGLTVLCSYNSDGQLNWATLFGTLNGYLTQIIATPNHDLIIAGDLTTADALDPGTTAVWYNPVGPSDVFLVMLDSSGNYQWSKVLYGNLTQEIKGLTMMSDTTFAFCGHTNAAFDLDPGPANCPIGWVSGYDPFIGFFHTDGRCDTGSVLAAGITPYALYFTGSSEFLFIGNSFPGNFILASLDTSFNFVYYSSYGNDISVRSSYYQYPQALFLVGHSNGLNNYGHDGNAMVYATTDPTTGFSCKYYLGWGPASVNEGSASQMFNVLPNPTADQFTIDLSSIPQQDGMLIINAANGTAVWEQNVNSGDAPLYTVDARDWSAGVYFISFRGSVNCASQKFIKVE